MHGLVAKTCDEKMTLEGPVARISFICHRINEINDCATIIFAVARGRDKTTQFSLQKSE